MKAEGVEVERQEDATYLGTVSKPFKGKRRVSPAEPGSVCFDRLAAPERWELFYPTIQNPYHRNLGFGVFGRSQGSRLRVRK